jgi:hypothetical protein
MIVGASGGLFGPATPSSHRYTSLHGYAQALDTPCKFALTSTASLVGADKTGFGISVLIRYIALALAIEQRNCTVILTTSAYRPGHCVFVNVPTSHVTKEVQYKSAEAVVLFLATRHLQQFSMCSSTVYVNTLVLQFCCNVRAYLR